ncbi:unnamed protein product [Rangifer tarandus platyrhynchus]|uniref:Uncharacterized protein n=2 Tax=Rangifer tarandus platyrhynchus TaxID=3082113 RepID=A0AC59ZVQ9_RANTA|nr:unnamed protein product [Rangifer tarandus platyrhynchus]
MSFSKGSSRPRDRTQVFPHNRQTLYCLGSERGHQAGGKDRAFPKILTALLHSIPCCVYRPIPLKFSLSRHLLNYASLSANREGGGLSRGTWNHSGFWKTWTSSGPAWSQFLNIISMTLPALQPCRPKIYTPVCSKSQVPAPLPLQTKLLLLLSATPPPTV